MEVLVRGRHGVWWGKTERVHIDMCQLSISESIWSVWMKEILFGEENVKH